MKTIVAIPARWESKRFPGKPLAEIAGKPMLQHVIEGVLQASQIDEVLVATDDDRIAGAAEQAGAVACMTGPAASGSDRIAAAIRQRRDIDIVINVQGDEPLIDGQVIESILLPFKDPNIEVTTACRKFRDDENPADPNRVKVVRGITGNALYFSRSLIPHTQGSSESATCHNLHVGIYGFRRDALLRFSELPPSRLEQLERLEQLRLLENNIQVHVSEVDWFGIGVDSPEDIGLVEHHLKGDNING